VFACVFLILLIVLIHSRVQSNTQMFSSFAYENFDTVRFINQLNGTQLSTTTVG